MSCFSRNLEYRNEVLLVSLLDIKMDNLFLNMQVPSSKNRGSLGSLVPLHNLEDDYWLQPLHCM